MRPESGAVLRGLRHWIDVRDGKILGTLDIFARFLSSLSLQYSSVVVPSDMVFSRLKREDNGKTAKAGEVCIMGGAAEPWIGWIILRVSRV